MGEFVKLDINDISGAALRWAMAVALGYTIEPANDKRLRVLDEGELIGSFMIDGSHLPKYLAAWEPDINWTQSGYYLELLNVSVIISSVAGVWHCSTTSPHLNITFRSSNLSLPLAITRCLLACCSRGFEFSVPKRLVS